MRTTTLLLMGKAPIYTILPNQVRMDLMEIMRQVLVRKQKLMEIMLMLKEVAVQEMDRKE